MDPATRYLKAAAAAPALAIITNQTAPLDPTLRAGFDEAYARCFTDPGNERARDAVETTRRELTDDIDRSQLYCPVEATTYPWTNVYTTGGYLALLDTYSHVAVLDPARRDAFFEDIGSVIDGNGGRLIVPYVAMLFLARRR